MWSKWSYRLCPSTDIGRLYPSSMKRRSSSMPFLCLAFGRQSDFHHYQLAVMVCPYLVAKNNLYGTVSNYSHAMYVIASSGADIWSSVSDALWCYTILRASASIATTWFFHFFVRDRPHTGRHFAFCLIHIRRLLDETQEPRWYPGPPVTFPWRWSP